MQILHGVHRAEQAAALLFAQQTKDTNTKITVRQAVVLDAIKANDGASQTVLADATGIDRSTLAEMVRRLKTKGWVDRRRTKADMRAYAVKLTAEGAKQLTLAKVAAAKAEKALVAQFPGVKHLVNGKGA